MSRLRALPERWPVRSLIRFACYLSLASLSTLALSVLVPTALPVMFAMSMGQLVAAAAFGCYLLAVIADAARSSEPGTPRAVPEDPEIGLGAERQP
jgi:hypothetical protein